LNVSSSLVFQDPSGLRKALPSERKTTNQSNPIPNCRRVDRQKDGTHSNQRE
jgi:hypothetical protein